MWKTWETAGAPSGEKFQSSQVSVDPKAGFSVTVSLQLSAVLMPLPSTVPHRYCEIEPSWKLDICSLKETRLVFAAPAGLARDGSVRWRGGTDVSLDFSGTTVNRMTV